MSVKDSYIRIDTKEQTISTGMTLRDYFAAHALRYLTHVFVNATEVYWDEAARQAYLAADAMLKERAK